MGRRRGKLTGDSGTVVALDIATGQPKWDLSEAAPQSRVVQASADAALVVLEKLGKDDPQQTRVVRLSDGSPIATISPTAKWCATDGAQLIACSVAGDPGENRIATYTSGGDTVNVSKAPIPEQVVASIWGGYILLGGYSKNDVYPVIDRAGNVLSDDLPGRAVEITDEYAVFSTSENPGEDSGSFAVYAITQ